MNVPTVRLVDITKTFGSLVANDRTNLTIRPGEVLALLGENGAGKSTLMNVLSGMYKPTSGMIFLDDKAVEFDSPRSALRNGIGMIYQHFKLVERMTALENVIEGRNRGFFLNLQNGRKRFRELCERTGLYLDPDKPVYGMSISERQTLEILKVLYCDARILILDEPTAVLTPQEAERLFAVIAQMRDSGHSIVIITHKMHEVMAISDRVAVLRGGKNVGELRTGDVTPSVLVGMMVGEKLREPPSGRKREPGKKAVDVKGLSIIDANGVKVLDDMTFSVFAGEVLGVAGVAGSGQKALCEALSGMVPMTRGDVLYGNESVRDKKKPCVSSTAIKIGFVPENRLGSGLVGSMNIVDNLLLRSYAEQKGWLLSRKGARKLCDRLVRDLEIKTRGAAYPVKMMSGGNIQKVMIGREIRDGLDFFIAAYPVRGLDTGASDTVYGMIASLRDRGVPVLLVGEDLDHLIAECDRIMVLCEGKIMGIVSAKDATREALGEMMSGKRLTGEGWV